METQEKLLFLRILLVSVQGNDLMMVKFADRRGRDKLMST